MTASPCACPVQGMGKTGRGLMTVAAALLATACASSPASAAPIHRVVAVGDLHGDFPGWRAIARAAGLVDAQGRWTGGRAVFVQTGDEVDRGPDSLKIVRDLMRLQGEARRAGGQVIALVGNHEAMNVTDDLRYVSAADLAAYVTPDSGRLRDRVYAANTAAIEAAYRKADPKLTAEAIRAAWIGSTPLGQIEHARLWHAGGEIGRWLVGEPAVVQLDGVIYAHGGISAAESKTPIAEINRQVAAALAAQETAPTSILSNDQSPLWYRGLALNDPDGASPAVEQELATVLAAYGARRMVIGHTPILSGIAVTHGGKLIRIDTGISAVFGGKLTWLEILDGGSPTAHDVARPADSVAPAQARPGMTGAGAR